MSGRVTSSFEITGWEEAPYEEPGDDPKLLRALVTKIFHEAKHHGDGRGSLSYKAPLGIQDILVGSDPAQFFVPPYVGHLGWIGVRLGRRRLGRSQRLHSRELPDDGPEAPLRHARWLSLSVTSPPVQIA